MTSTFRQRIEKGFHKISLKGVKSFVSRFALPIPRVHGQRIKWAFWLLPLSLIIGSYLLIFKDLPSPKGLETYSVPLATKIYDRNGILLHDIFVEENRTAVTLSEIPLYVREATISIEDKNFYKHGGVSPIGGMLRAVVATITGKRLQGGSTITQQLVKTALLTPQRSVVRKIREIVLSFWVELLYPKDKILELYLNQVPYGGTAWGIETAAEKYFAKRAKDLTLAEASLLAGLPQAPTYYSPFGAHPELAKNRQVEVLRRMVEDGYITQAEAEKAKKEALVYAKQTNIRAPHFIMYVKEKLVEEFGETLVARGGLNVTTTLDITLQDYAQATVAAEIKDLEHYDVSNGAALITKPATGEILAMVGSVDYFATPSGSFNVTTALRQPGSSIKPINYGIGIEQKRVTPATMFLDVPTCFASINQPLYCPNNYDFQFHGPQQLRFALGNSFNIPAVKMLKINSVEGFVASASAFGLSTIKDPKNYGLSLTLGGGEVRMTDMATAFSVFANSGVRKDLIAITKVTDNQGKILFEQKDPNLKKSVPSQILISGPRVLSAETAYLISHILLDNNARAAMFGTNSALVIPGHAVSVKTGTTDEHRDNWTIGYTPQFLIAVWVGNNNNTRMNQALVSGVTGAAPIWNKLMKRVLENQPDIWPKQPEGIVGAEVCTTTGLLPPNSEGDKGCSTRYEYFIKGTVPTAREQLRMSVPIDKTTGDLATQTTAPENVEIQDHDVLRDELSMWCLDCNHDAKKPVIIR